MLNRVCARETHILGASHATRNHEGGRDVYTGERSEAYSANFASENDALTLDKHYSMEEKIP
jgi:hypothetical protein